MSWVRLDDHAPEHPKQLKAGPVACWLWVCGLAWSSRHLTNGDIPREVVTTFSIKDAAKHVKRLVEVGLWELTSDGYRVHDYLHYQPSGKQVDARRHAGKARLDAWRMKRGYIGGCNADETALQDIEKRKCNGVSNINPVPVPVPVPNNLRSTAAKAKSLDSDDTDQRAGNLVRRYAELYTTHRHGAHLRARPSLDWSEACDLVKLWPDDRLEKLAILVLTTDDDWISTTDRSFRIFALKASWADSKLSEWEHAHQVSA